MIGHHQGAVEIARAEIANGDNVDAIDLAKDDRHAQEAEIAQMKSMVEAEVAAHTSLRRSKENYAKRLHRIEGQVRGIAKMIDEDSTSSTSSPRSARSTRTGIGRARTARRAPRPLRHAQAVAAGGADADAELAEASAAIARLVRS